MSIWEASPQNKTNVPNYRIVRTPATRPLRLVCMSPRHEGVNLHYWKGRSVPCSGAHCDACINGHAPRWKGYVLVKSPDTPAAAIFEFTERAWDAFEHKIAASGDLRGAIFTTRRTNRKVNGPLVVEFEDTRIDASTLPPLPDLRAMLERIWEVRQQFIPGVFTSEDDLATEAEARLA